MTIPKLKKKKFRLITFVVLLISTLCLGQNKEGIDDFKQINDSIYKMAVRNNNDSLLNAVLKSYVKYYYRRKDWKPFNKYRKEHLLVTSRIGDTTSHARTLEYTAAYFKKQHKIDSSYFYYSKSLELYKQTNDSLNIAFTLLNLAITQKSFRDYQGSISKLKKALTYIKGKAKPRRISSIYNTIGNNYSSMKQFDSALVYHNKSIEFRKSLKNPAYFVQSLNNIGNTYKRKKKYTLALSYFNKAMIYNKVTTNYPKIKATLISNKTHTLFLLGKTDKSIEQNLHKALSIYDSINDVYGKVMSYIHLAKFYKNDNNNEKAIYYIRFADSIAKKIHNHQNRINALEEKVLLFDGEEKEQAMINYVSIRDSLDFADKMRLVRLYDIDEKSKTIIAKKTSETEEYKKANITIRVIFFIAFLLLTYFIFILYQKKRKVSKAFKQKLSKSNSELQIVNNKLDETKEHLVKSEKELDKKKLQIHSMKDSGLNNHSPEYLADLHKVIKSKYNLSSENVEFLLIFIKGLTQKEQMDVLKIKKDTLDKRRTSLKNKINKKRNINGSFTWKLAKRIYMDEEALFKFTVKEK